VGQNGESHAVARNRRGVDPRHAQLHRDIVDQEARLEIVSAVQDEREAGQEFLSIPRAEVGDHALHGHIGVDGMQPAFGGDGFGQRVAGVGLVEQRLALQVRGLDEVAVNDAEMAQSGAHKQVGERCAQRARTDKHRARGQQALLTGLADRGEEDLSRIFAGELGVHLRVLGVCAPQANASHQASS